MGGPAHITLYCEHEAGGEAAITAAVAEIERLEQRYSRYRPDSLVSRINASGGDSVAIDPETHGLLAHADTLFQLSDGLFDITAGVLNLAWDFRASEPPAAATIDALLPLVGWARVEWDEDFIRLPQPGMQIDFGGCVKEYACDAAAVVLAEHGVTSGLVNLAGDIAAVGPMADDQPWPVAIENPTGGAIAHIELIRGGLASSGNYARFIDASGQRYGHILSPNTGWPVQGLQAVSVQAPQCLVAGSSATLAMLMAPQQALDWLSQLGLAWFAVDADGACHGSIATAAVN